MAALLLFLRWRHFCLGLATAEALAFGLPAVGFRDCPGTNELIEDGVNGVLVDALPGRPAALALALEDLMLDPVRRRRLAGGGAAVRARYGAATVLDQWESLLERTLEAAS